MRVMLVFSLDKMGSKDLKKQMVRCALLSLPSKITVEHTLGAKITTGTAVLCSTLFNFSTQVIVSNKILISLYEQTLSTKLFFFFLVASQSLSRLGKNILNLHFK